MLFKIYFVIILPASPKKTSCSKHKSCRGKYMKKLQKKDFVLSLTEKLQKAKSVILVDFAKMNVISQQSLKKELRSSNAKLIVAKNTLIKIAGKEAKLPEEMLTDTVLSGQTAVILGNDDPVSPIQILGKFLKTSEIPQPKAGVIDGTFQDKNNIITISKLPSKNELFAQVIGSIQSPAYGLVSTLQSNLQKLVWILQAKAAN